MRNSLKDQKKTKIEKLWDKIVGHHPYHVADNSTYRARIQIKLILNESFVHAEIGSPFEKLITWALVTQMEWNLWGLKYGFDSYILIQI